MTSSSSDYPASGLGFANESATLSRSEFQRNDFGPGRREIGAVEGRKGYVSIGLKETATSNRQGPDTVHHARVESRSNSRYTFTTCRETGEINKHIKLRDSFAPSKNTSRDTYLSIRFSLLPLLSLLRPFFPIQVPPSSETSIPHGSLPSLFSRANFPSLQQPPASLMTVLIRRNTVSSPASFHPFLAPGAL